MWQDLCQLFPEALVTELAFVNIMFGVSWPSASEWILLARILSYYFIIIIIMKVVVVVLVVVVVVILQVLTWEHGLYDDDDDDDDALWPLMCTR